MKDFCEMTASELAAYDGPVYLATVTYQKWCEDEWREIISDHESPSEDILRRKLVTLYRGPNYRHLAITPVRRRYRPGEPEKHNEQTRSDS
jgi:hypothetical protein